MNDTEKRENNRIKGVFPRFGAFLGRWRGVIGSGLAILIILVVFISASMAWNLTNKQTYDADGTVESDGVNASVLPYSLYVKHQTVSGDNVTYNVQVYSSGDGAELNSYDAIMGRNDYTSAYIRMPVYGVPEGSTLTFTVTCTGSIGTNDEDGVNSTDNVTNNILMAQYLSNIIEVSCANIRSSVISTSASKEDVYTNALNWFSDSANASAIKSGTFVQYRENTGTGRNKTAFLSGKNPTVTFTLAPGDYAVEDDGMVYVYFKLDYKYELVDAYITALRLTQGGFKLNESGHADFTGTVENVGFDLSTIALEISGGD